MWSKSTVHLLCCELSSKSWRQLTNELRGPLSRVSVPYLSQRLGRRRTYMRVFARKLHRQKNWVEAPGFVLWSWRLFTCEAFRITRTTPVAKLKSSTLSWRGRLRMFSDFMQGTQGDNNNRATSTEWITDQSLCHSLGSVLFCCTHILRTLFNGNHKPWDHIEAGLLHAFAGNTKQNHYLSKIAVFKSHCGS